MDCSGLLMASYTSIGMNIPRTSGEQSKFGEKARFNDLRKGDWVFFAKKKGKRKITHVGLVTGVRGKDNVKFIHASSSLGVVEADLHSKYYKDRFVKARRPF
jgi:probable lipoprotein NlpC